MALNTLLPSQIFSNSISVKSASPASLTPSIPSNTSRRFTILACASFALTLPLLGFLDPKVLWALGMGDVAALRAAMATLESAMRRMDLLEWLATGGAAVVALAVIGILGSLRKGSGLAHLADTHG